MNSLEIRIGFHTDLGEVEATVLIFFAAANTDGVLDNQPDNRGSNQNKGGCSSDTNELGQEAGTTVSKGNSHGAPDTADQVNRESTDDIVNLEFVEERNREDNQNTTDSTDQNSRAQVMGWQDRQ